MDELQARLNKPLLKHIIELLPQDQPIYLVGGAIRDALLNRPSYDLDFVTLGGTMKTARKLANDLGAAFFPLDPMRKVARLILRPSNDEQRGVFRTIRVDFSAFQGADLIEDLNNRDFTINAMAVEIHHLNDLIDPTCGAQDLIVKHLRLCSPASLLNDPVRILRAVRFSVDLDLSILPETLQLMKDATPMLPEVSSERLRDELFRILAIANPATSLRILDRLNALEYLLPEAGKLKAVQQSQPHVMDVWNHTLDVLKRLESLLDVLAVEYDPGKADNLTMGLVVLRLGRYRQQLAEHLGNALNPDRPHRGLLFLAGLYHDIGKQATQSVDANGKLRFIGHEQVGSKLVEKRGKELKLSRLEIDRLMTIVSHHMRPSLLSHDGELPSKKAVYRFFRDTGAAGVDICILSLADMLATYGPTLSQERWDNHLEAVRVLLRGWWEDREEGVFPVPLIDGNELMRVFKLSPGPQLGYLLESIREAQISKEVSDRSEALKLVEKLLREIG